MPSTLMRLLAAFMLLAGLAACESAEERVAGHLERGLELVAAGQDAKARLEFANALKIAPDTLRAHLEMARLYERQGNPRAMAGHLLKIIELDPGDGWARTRMAGIALMSGEAEMALEHAEAALKIMPDSAEALAVRAAVNYALDHHDIALADAARAMALEPDQPIAGGVLVRGRIAAKDLDGARTLAETLLAAHPQTEDLNRLHLGIVLEQGDAAAVGARLAKLTEYQPDVFEYWTALMQWYLETGDPAGGFARLRAHVASVENPYLARQFAELAAQLAASMRAGTDPQAVRTALAGLAEEAALPWIYRRMLAAYDYADGRPEAARKALLAMIAEAGPAEAAEAQVMLARMALSEGRTAEAEERVGAVLAGDAGHTEALALRAVLRLKAGAPETALNDLRLALADAPENAQLLALLSETQLRLGNRTLAGEALAQAMKVTDFAAAETLRYAEFLIGEDRAEAAETILAEAMRRHPGERAILLRLADLRLSLGKWLEVEPVTAALRRLDASGDAARIEAAALQSQQRYAESLEILKGLGDDPGTREAAMSQLVRTYMIAGKREEAEAYLASVLEETPDHPQALFLTALMQEEAGDAAGAETLLRRLVAVEPGAVPSHEVLADFLTRHGKPAAAIEAIRAGLAQLPGAPQLQLRLALLHETAGDPEAAIAIYEEMHEAGNASLIVINNLVSLINDHQADRPERRAFARKIAAPLQGSREPAFRDTYGWLLYLDGDAEAALAELIPAAAALPDNPWVRYHLGMAFTELGRPGDARPHLEAALKLGGAEHFPPSAQIRTMLEGG